MMQHFVFMIWLVINRLKRLQRILSTFGSMALKRIAWEDMMQVRLSIGRVPSILGLTKAKKFSAILIMTTPVMP
jgi:hypothetical protein